jgi:hypothetical protein
MKLTPQEKKELIIYFIIVIFVLILMGGNELGQFRNTDQADARLDPVLYVICVTPILLFIFIRKVLNEFTLKLKIFTVILSMVVALMPMFLLSGLGKYIDYYTTDKHWTKEDVTIINKSSSGGGRGATTYLYRVKIKDTTIMLYSKLSYPIDEVLHLKMCKTRLGMIIGKEYHDQD